MDNYRENKKRLVKRKKTLSIIALSMLLEENIEWLLHKNRNNEDQRIFLLILGITWKYKRNRETLFLFF